MGDSLNNRGWKGGVSESVAHRHTLDGGWCPDCGAVYMYPDEVHVRCPVFGWYTLPKDAPRKCPFGGIWMHVYWWLVHLG